jgi:hypothetical protein
MAAAVMRSTAMVVMMEMRELLEMVEMMEANRPDQHGRTAIRPPWTEAGFVRGRRIGDIRPDRFRAGYHDSRQDDRREDNEPAHALDMDRLGRIGKRAGKGQAALQAIVIDCDPPVNLPVDFIARLHGKFAF